MAYSCKVGGELNSPVVIYYKKGSFVDGKLVKGRNGNYFAGDDGRVYPVLLTGKGNWMTVVTKNKVDRNVLNSQFRQ